MAPQGSGFGLEGQRTPEAAANKEPRAPTQKETTPTLAPAAIPAGPAQQPTVPVSSPATGVYGEAANAARERVQSAKQAQIEAQNAGPAPEEPLPQNRYERDAVLADQRAAAEEAAKVPQNITERADVLAEQPSAAEIGVVPGLSRGGSVEIQSILEKETAAAAVAKRTQLLQDAGFGQFSGKDPEAELKQILELNPGKTEEQVIGIYLANNEKWKKTYAHDIMQSVGAQLKIAKTQVTEAFSGQGEHVLGGPAGELNGLERAAKVAQSVLVTGVSTLFTPISYATGEIAQNEAMLSPVAPRLYENLKASGLDPASSESPNARLEVVNQTLMDAYLHGTQEEANYAAAILVQRGYLEFVAGGGAQMTQSGVNLVRNAARLVQATRVARAARAALEASGGLERRIGAQGVVSSEGAASIAAKSAAGRIAAVAPTDERMVALATRLATQERAAAEVMNPVAVSPVVNAPKVTFGSTEGVSSAAGGQSGGFFDPRTGEIRIDKDAMLASAGGKRALVAATIHEFVHAGQWLASGRNLEKWTAMDDIERLPSQIQEAVLRLMGVPREAMHDPNVASMWQKGGLKGQISTALKKFAADESAKGTAPETLPKTSLQRYADAGQENKLLDRLNRMRWERTHGANPSGTVSAEENALADRILGMRAQRGAAGERFPTEPKTAYDTAAPKSALPTGKARRDLMEKTTSRSPLDIGNEKDLTTAVLNMQQNGPRHQSGAFYPDDIRIMAQKFGKSPEEIKTLLEANGGRGQVVNAPAEVLPSSATSAQHGDLVHGLTMKNGGATYNLKEGDLAGQDRWAVGAYPERAVTITGDVSPGDITKFIDDNKSLLENGKTSVGTWKDPETGNTVLDIVKTPGSADFLASRNAKSPLLAAQNAARDQAIQIAKEAGQDAIYNLKTGKTIKTPRAEAHPMDIAAIKQRIQTKGTPELFAKARKWYTNAGEFARAMSNQADFAPSTIPLRKVAAAMAALSPQNEWSGVTKMDNLKAIYKLIRGFERGDKGPFDIEEGMNMNGIQVQKAWAALTTKGDPMDVLIGPKERSFALNILGERDLATVDKHIRGAQPSVAAKPAGNMLSAAEHDRIQSAYQSALDELKGEGTIPPDWNARDLQAADWGIISGNDLNFVSKDTFFPGTPPENMPYTVSPGVGEEPPAGFTPPSVFAPREALGGMKSAAFQKYKSVGDIVRAVKSQGFNGIADFSAAVKDNVGLENVSPELIHDFAHGHIEQGMVGIVFDAQGRALTTGPVTAVEEIDKLATKYADLVKSGYKGNINDFLTEELTGRPKGRGPTAAAPSSPLSMGKDGSGEPKLIPSNEKDDPAGIGGISGIGMDAHGSSGYGVPEALPLGIKTESGLVVKPSTAKAAELQEPRANIQPGGEERNVGTKLPGLKVEGSHEMNLKNAIKGFNDTERAMEASLDDSFVLNQGYFAMWTHPKEFGHMFVDSLKSISGKERFAKVNQEVNALPSHNLAVRSGVRFDNPGDSEFFQSKVLEALGDVGLPGGRKVGEVPVVGGAAKGLSTVVSGSDRGYTGAGNSLRGRIFDTLANGWDLMKVDGMEFNSPEYIKTMKLAKDLGDYTNIITGIGDVSMLPKVLQEIGPLFFAYKFMASKFNQLLSPLQYTQQFLRGQLPSRLRLGEVNMPMPLYLAPEHASSWQIAALAWRDIGLYAGGIYLTASAMKALGVDVGLDPEQESKFLQVSFGEGDSAQQWDLSGGMGKLFSMLYQTSPVIGTRHHVTKQGKAYSLDNVPFGQADASDLWGQYLTGKLGPMYSQGLQTLRGKNYQGNSPTPWDLLPLPITAKNATELFFSEAWKDPANWGAVLGQGFGMHGYVKTTTNEPQGPLGTPIRDMFGPKTPEENLAPPL